MKTLKLIFSKWPPHTCNLQKHVTSTVFGSETWFKNQNNEQNLQFWDMQISQIGLEFFSQWHVTFFFFFFFFEQKHDSRIKITSRTCSFETCRYLKLPNFKLRRCVHLPTPLSSIQFVFSFLCAVTATVTPPTIAGFEAGLEFLL